MHQYNFQKVSLGICQVQGFSRDTHMLWMYLVECTLCLFSCKTILPVFLIFLGFTCEHICLSQYQEMYSGEGAKNIERT